MGGAPSFGLRRLAEDADVTVPVSDLVFAASPRLAGRFSPGGGQGEEIALDGSFSIAGGTLALNNNAVALSRLVNAAAQFDVIGRRTAGAGAWEDCARTQLNIAGTDLANIFSLLQTINANVTAPNTALTGTILRVIQADAAQAVFMTETFGSFSRHSARRANGTAAVPTPISSGDVFMSNGGYGWTGAVYAQGVSQNFSASENWAVGAQGSRLAFNVTPNTTTNLQTALTLEHDLGVYLNSATGQSQGAGTFNAQALYANGNVIADTNGLLRRRPFTFATLPAAGTAGRQGAITDGAAAPLWLAAAAGAGAVYTPVTDNGASWRNG